MQKNETPTKRIFYHFGENQHSVLLDPLNQLGIFQTTAHRLTCRVSPNDTSVIRQPLPVELVDLSIVSKQAVYLFLNIRYLRVNVSRKALILQRFHLCK